MTSLNLGTVVLIEERTQGGPPQLDIRLKYDFSGENPVVLVPQPTDDPNDPLVSCSYCPASCWHILL